MVTPSTIQKCWWKSTCIKNPAKEEEIKDSQQAKQAEQAKQAKLQDQLALLPAPSNGKERLSIDDFINPTNEIIVDNNIDIFASVVEHHTADKEGKEDTDDEDIEVAKVPTAKALDALEVVKLWQLQQESSQKSLLQAVDQIGMEIVHKKYQGAKQTMINSFFTTETSLE
jgi:hypothetical protein